MKRIYSLIVAGGLLAAGCDSYFNEDLYQNIPQENAYATVSDVENALNGVYYAFGSYRFMGRQCRWRLAICLPIWRWQMRNQGIS